MRTLEQYPRNASEYTQGKMFSLVSTIFDPPGILYLLTVRIKMLLRQVWRIGKKWIKPLPAEQNSNLQKNLDSYFAMSDIEIPRLLNTSTNQENNHQLHVLVDASTFSLAAVAYICTQSRTKAFKRLSCSENAKLHQLNKLVCQKQNLKQLF